ncbi:MAG: ABC transporter transmembrane domain-containing protein [Acidobacteriota bacterium]|nr:ABC transporter transmembrane domain-containing protein [Acidobacteriota bacterium]
MSDLRRFGRYFVRYRWTLLAAIVSSIIASIFLGGVVSMIPNLVEAMVEKDPVTVESRLAGPADPAGEVSLIPAPVLELKKKLDLAWAPVRAWLLEKDLIRVPLFIVLLYVLKGVFGYLAVYGVRRAGLKAVADVRNELYAESIRQSDDFYRTRSTADILTRITLDVGQLQNLVRADVAQAVQSIPIVVVMLAVAMMFAWQIALACLLIIPVFAIIVAKLGQKIKKASRRSQERAAQLTGVIEETLLARRVVQAFGAEEYETRRFEQTQGRMLREDFRIARAMALTSPSIELFSAIFGASLIIYAGLLIRSGRVEGTSFLVAVVTLIVAFTNIRRLSQLNNAFQQGLASARRIFEILDATVTVRDRPGAGELPRFRREIRFDNVSYTYGRGPVLRGVSLTVRAGQTCALVGPSGSGKTTLAMLLPRFFDPTGGRVTIDGVDLQEVTLASLRAQIALVTQETHLFDDTVLANIAYGREDVSEPQIRSAARAAYAEEFISALPQGFETRLGDRGGRLSAGQRQRIAIARAFLRDAPILVLDEATSALDSESEHNVQMAIDALRQGRTALIIAHRLSTISGADAIHVLEEGRIVESGTHRELVSRSGRYAHLNALQDRA